MTLVKTRKIIYLCAKVNFLQGILKMKKQVLCLLGSLLLVSGCSWFSALNPWSEDEKPQAQPQEQNIVAQKIVNRYLWQASMEKMSKMPLQNTNLQNGTITSDWMVVNGVPNEKFKIITKVLGPDLRADGLKVEVLKMDRVDGEWVDAQPNPRLASEIEKIILQQASILYRRAVAAGEE